MRRGRCFREGHSVRRRLPTEEYFDLGFDHDGEDGIRVVDSSSVILSETTSSGGDGGDHVVGFICGVYDGFGGDGGDGLTTVNSSVAVHGGSLRGGNGAASSGYNNHDHPYDGGHGVVVAAGASLCSSGSAFQGGNGGYTHYDCLNPGADGGDGVRTAAGAGALLLGVTTGGGAAPGSDGCGSGTPGLPTSGPVTLLPGSPRSLDAPALVAPGAPLPLTVQGEPGDLVVLLLSGVSQFQYVPAWSGYLTIAPVAPTYRRARIVTLPASGMATVTLNGPSPRSDHRRIFLQTIHRSTTGEQTLATPRVLSIAP